MRLFQLRPALLPALLALAMFAAPAAGGTVHRVREGDTLYGIGRSYGVGVERIREANEGLTELIRPGQRIRVPAAGHGGQIEDILRTGTSDRWRYVVIHHSATDCGCASSFEQAHMRRGYRALGYHFVIGNGSYTSAGAIETGRRWLEQWDGAHARGDANRFGIGICLVGNFEESRPGPAQMDSLARLVSALCLRYDIPLSNVRGHRDFNGCTKCPGRRFPWAAFRNELRRNGVR